MKKALLFLSMMIATACAEDGPNPQELTTTYPGDEGSDTNGNDGDDTAGITEPDPDDGGIDSSGGDVCEEDGIGHYTCYGWVAGIYCQNSDPQVGNVCSNTEIVFTGTTYANCVGNIEACSPWMGVGDNPTLFQDCQDNCNEAVIAGDFNGMFPTTVASGTWTLDGVACVYALNGNAGTIPIGTVYHYPGNAAVAGTVNDITQGQAYLQAECTNVKPLAGGGYPAVEQTNFEGCYLDDETCLGDCTCAGWNPDGQSTYSYNAGTRVHTVTISRAFLYSLFDGDWEKLYKCDGGSRFGTYSWTILSAVSGDLLYRFGLRAWDHHLTLKKMPTGTTYSLTSFTSIMNAMTVALTGTVGTVFQVTFRRPKATAPYYDTHTINITLTT